jgi:hypothetical protein
MIGKRWPKCRGITCEVEKSMVVSAWGRFVGSVT